MIYALPYVGFDSFDLPDSLERISLVPDTLYSTWPPVPYSHSATTTSLDSYWGTSGRGTRRLRNMFVFYFSVNSMPPSGGIFAELLTGDFVEVNL